MEAKQRAPGTGRLRATAVLGKWVKGRTPPSLQGPLPLRLFATKAGRGGRTGDALARDVGRLPHLEGSEVARGRCGDGWARPGGNSAQLIELARQFPGGELGVARGHVAQALAGEKRRARAVHQSVISSLVSLWSVELEPEVQTWLESLASVEFATAAFQIDRLAEQGAALRMPHSRALGEGLFELRFDLGRLSQRITFFFPGERRVVLLTVFRKQRSNERSEVERARTARRRCIEQAHTAEE